MLRGIVNDKGWGMPYPKILSKRNDLQSVKKIIFDHNNQFKGINTSLIQTK